MAKTVYLCSTLSCDNAYALYEPMKEGDTIRRIKKGPDNQPLKMVVKGGANVADKRLITPRGVITKVDGDLYEAVKENEAFKRHVDRGFITITNRLKKDDADKVAADMTSQDKSAPKTEKDYEKKGKKAPKTGSAED